MPIYTNIYIYFHLRGCGSRSYSYLTKKILEECCKAFQVKREQPKQPAAICTPRQAIVLACWAGDCSPERGLMAFLSGKMTMWVVRSSKGHKWLLLTAKAQCPCTNTLRGVRDPCLPASFHPAEFSRPTFSTADWDTLRTLTAVSV